MLGMSNHQIHLDLLLECILLTRGIILNAREGLTEVHADVIFEPPVTISTAINLDAPAEFGAFTHSNGSQLSHCTIGRYCSISPGVEVGHGGHPTDWLSVSALQYAPNVYGWSNFLEVTPRRSNSPEFEPILHTTIGNDVWIGANSFIKAGISIGDGAIIGAGSVVTRDVAPYAVVGGNPAKLIKYRFDETVIDRIQASKWWHFAIPNIKGADFSNPIETLDIIEKESAAGRLQAYTPEKISLISMFTYSEQVKARGLAEGFMKKFRKALKHS